jgi:hypothetical protein
MMGCLKPNMTTSRYVLIFGFASLLIACSNFPSQNIDPSKNNKTNFEKDLGECKEDYPESSAGLHYKLWADCMNLKGWK